MRASPPSARSGSGSQSGTRGTTARRSVRCIPGGCGRRWRGGRGLRASALPPVAAARGTPPFRPSWCPPAPGFRLRGRIRGRGRGLALPGRSGWRGAWCRRRRSPWRGVVCASFWFSTSESKPPARCRENAARAYPGDGLQVRSLFAGSLLPTARPYAGRTVRSLAQGREGRKGRGRPW